MTFHIRLSLLLMICFHLPSSYAQEDETNKLNRTNKIISFLFDEESQKTFSFHINYRQPIAVGNNFLAEAYKSNGGYDLKMQIYPYKNFFIGGALSYSFFEVTNNTLVGNYNRTTSKEAFWFIGYDFIPFKNSILGVNVSFASDVTLKNNIQDSDRYQRDFGKLSHYGLYFAYEFSNNFAVYLDYSYRILNTSINAPSALNNFFDQGQYHNIAIGIKISAGHKDLFSVFSNAGNWFKRNDNSKN